jgi:Leucine-rich repeat (LRR) protein
MAGLLVNLSAINISNSGLQTMSDEICKLPWLRYLVASYNKLTLLPENIGSLQALMVDTHITDCSCLHDVYLQALEADHNNLTEVPPSLGRCTKLASLSLHDNSIHALPKELGTLRCKITLDGNPLEDPLMGMYSFYLSSY